MKNDPFISEAASKCYMVSTTACLTTTRDAVVYGHKATCMLFLIAFQKWHFYIAILVNSIETQSKFK